MSFSATTQLEKRRLKQQAVAEEFGLDYFEHRKSFKSGSGWIDHPDRRGFLQQKFGRDELSAEERQIKKTRDDMVSALSQYQVTYGMESRTVADLPWAYYTKYLLPFLLERHSDLLEVESLVAMEVENSLTFLDSLHDRKKEKLEPFYSNKELLGEWIDLLMIGQSYPSRAEILHQEAQNGSARTERRGQLRDDVVKGRMTQFILAVDVFLEYSARQLSGRLIERSPPLAKITQELWSHVDQDGDDILSMDEAEEITRVILSRPIFGKLLIAMVCNDPKNSSWAPQAADLRGLVPSEVCQAATGVCSIAKEFWLIMDSDNDREVTGQEFSEFFPVAFEKAIASPIAVKLAVVGQWFSKPAPQEFSVVEGISELAEKTRDLKRSSLVAAEQLRNTTHEQLRNTTHGSLSSRTTSLSTCDTKNMCDPRDSCGRRQKVDPNDPIIALHSDRRDFPEADRFAEVKAEGFDFPKPPASANVDVAKVPTAANVNAGPSCNAGPSSNVAKPDGFEDVDLKEWDEGLAKAQICNSQDHDKMCQADAACHNKGCSIM